MGHIGGPPPAPIGCRKRRKPRDRDITDFDGGLCGGFRHGLEKHRHGGGSSHASSDHVRESQRRCSRSDARVYARKMLGIRSQSGQEPRRGDRDGGRRARGRDSGTAPSCIGSSYHNQQQRSEDHRPTGTSSVRGWPVNSTECRSADEGYNTPTSSACVKTANDKVGGNRHQSEITSEAGGEDALERVRSSCASKPDPLHAGGAGSSSRTGKGPTTMLASSEEIAVVTRILGGGSADGSRLPYATPSPTRYSSVEKNDTKNRPSLVRVSLPLRSSQLPSLFVESYDGVPRACPVY